MSKQTYYATEEDMFGSSDGSKGVTWTEVTIIGVNRINNKRVLLVRSLDGSKTFTALEDHTFIKTEDMEEV